MEGVFTYLQSLGKYSRETTFEILKFTCIILRVDVKLWEYILSSNCYNKHCNISKINYFEGTVNISTSMTAQIQPVRQMEHKAFRHEDISQRKENPQEEKRKNRWQQLFPSSKSSRSFILPARNWSLADVTIAKGTEVGHVCSRLIRSLLIFYFILLFSSVYENISTGSWSSPVLEALPKTPYSFRVYRFFFSLLSVRKNISKVPAVFLCSEFS